MLNPRTHFRSRSGISLLIAMLMVMAFMLMMASTMTAMTRSLKIAQGGAASDQAYLNAVAGLELGMYRQNYGEEAYQGLIKAIALHDGTTVGDGTSVTLGQGTVNVQITDNISGGGRVCVKDPDLAAGALKGTGDATKDLQDNCTQDKIYYVYPFPGTGTLGSSYCNPVSQPAVRNEQWYRDMYYYVNGTSYTGTGYWTNPKEGDEKKVVDFLKLENLTTLDHPCLWNKLEPGVAAEIPLGDHADQISEFWLRVRLPCKSGTVCNTEASDLGGVGRMQLFISDTKTQKDTRALLWEIVAKCGKANCFIRDIGPASVLAYQEKNKKNPIPNNPKLNLEIQAIGSTIQHSLINLISPSSSLIYTETMNNSPNIANIVLGLVNQAASPIYASNYEQNLLLTKIKDFFANKNPKNAVMHLSIASNLTTGSVSLQSAIPYVEYQILYQNTDKGLNAKPLITNPTVISTGSYGGYSIDLESSLTKQVGTFGYGLIGK